MHFLWRRELIKRQHSPHHRPLVEQLVESIGLLLLKINSDMASADDHAILAQTPYDLYAGENCKAVGTLHIIVNNNINYISHDA
jgi:hypothetical protein